MGLRFAAAGFPAAWSLVGPDYGLLQLVAPVDLAQLKAAAGSFRLEGIELLAVHKKEVHRGLLWKERTAQLFFRDGEKVPKQAVLRLRVSRIGERIARQLPLAEEPPAKRPALPSKAVPALTFEPIAEAFPELPKPQAMEELQEIPEPEKAPEVPVETAEAAEPEKAPEAPVEPPEEAVPEKALELYEMPMGGKMLRFYFLRTELVRRITHAVVKLHGAEDHALLETRRDDFKMFPGKGEQSGLCYIHNSFFEREAQKVDAQILEQVDAQILEPKKVEPVQVEPVEPVQRRGGPLGRQPLRPTKDDKPAEAKPAEDDKPAEDPKPAEAKPAEDAMEASSSDKPPEMVEPAAPDELQDKPAEDAKPAEDTPPKDAMEASSSDKPPELPQPDGADAVAEPAAPDELQDKPAEETEEAKTDEPAAVAEDDVETLHGLKVRKVEGDWYELAARTLDEFEEALKILTAKLKDGTFAEYKLKRAENRWTTELFEVRWDTGKLWLPRGRRSVLAQEARVRVRLSA